jgi:hypothetical protein
LKPPSNNLTTEFVPLFIDVYYTMIAKRDYEAESAALKEDALGKARYKFSATTRCHPHNPRHTTVNTCTMLTILTRSQGFFAEGHATG